MDAEAADLDAVFACNGFDEGGFADDLDEFFAGVAGLVEGADVAGGHGVGEGDGDGVLLRKRRGWLASRAAAGRLTGKGERELT